MGNPVRQVFDPSLVMNKSKIIMNRFGNITNDSISKNFNRLCVSGDGKTKVIYNMQYNVTQATSGELLVGQQEITILSDNKLKAKTIVLPSSGSLSYYPTGRALYGMQINYDGNVILVADAFDGAGTNGEILIYRFDGTVWSEPQTIDGIGEPQFALFSAFSGNAISKDGSLICGGTYNQATRPLRVFRYNGTSYIEEQVNTGNIKTAQALSLTNDNQEICVSSRGPTYVIEIYKYNNGEWSVVWVGDRLNPNWEAAGLPINRINTITLQKVDNYRILFVPSHPQEPSSRPVILKLNNLNQGTLPTVIQTFNNGYYFRDINPEGNYMLMDNDAGKAIVYKTTDNWTTYSETSKLHIYVSPVDKNEGNEDVYSLESNMRLSHDNVIYSLINYNPYNSISDRIISLIKVPYGNKTTFINGILDDVEYLE
jgi:hypothetical protein